MTLGYAQLHQALKGGVSTEDQASPRNAAPRLETCRQEAVHRQHLWGSPRCLPAEVEVALLSHILFGNSFYCPTAFGLNAFALP